jgi:hypothetical protein
LIADQSGSVLVSMYFSNVTSGPWVFKAPMSDPNVYKRRKN